MRKNVFFQNLEIWTWDILEKTHLGKNGFCDVIRGFHNFFNFSKAENFPSWPGTIKSSLVSIETSLPLLQHFKKSKLFYYIVH